MGHLRRDLASFSQGEVCFVFARDRRDPDGPPYYLVDGSVTDEVRQFTREFLECPLPDCPDRWITAVARTSKRQGFSHRPGAGGHSPESVFHFTAKSMIARWAAEASPGVVARLEQSTDDRSRRADVMITFPTGQQVAVEVQYAALSVPDWQRRHESYAAQGITCVWLLGHLPPHLNQADGARVNPTDLHSAIIDAGAPILWVHPDGWIGTATSTVEGFTVPPEVSDWRGWVFSADPLSDCTLDPLGIGTPTLISAARGAGELAEHRRLQREAHARETERRRVEAAAKAETQERRAAYAQRKQREQRAAWLTDPMRQRIIDRYGKLPEPITTRSFPDNGVFADPERWHALLCRDLLHGKVGRQFTVRDAYRVIKSAGIEMHPQKEPRGETVNAYLCKLDELGLIRIVRDPQRPWRIQHCDVVADLDAYDEQQRATPIPLPIGAQPAVTAPYAPATGAQPASSQPLRVAARAQVGSTAAVPPASQATVPAPRFGQPPAAPLTCRRCGGILDEALRRSGKHVLC